MGTGGSGRTNVMMSKFRGSMGNPLLLEERLARHPKLRVQVMHTFREVNRYIERLVDAGFAETSSESLHCDTLPTAHLWMAVFRVSATDRIAIPTKCEHR